MLDHTKIGHFLGEVTKQGILDQWAQRNNVSVNAVEIDKIIDDAWRRFDVASKRLIETGKGKSVTIVGKDIVPDKVLSRVELPTALESNAYSEINGQSIDDWRKVANVLDGGAGNDYISGGAGDDILHGFTGNDYLYGGEGDDVFSHATDNLFGASPDGGTDVIVGGGGADSLALIRGTHTYFWTDFEDGTDKIDITKLDIPGIDLERDVQISSTLDGTGTWIGIGDMQIVLNGVDADNITLDDDFTLLTNQSAAESLLHNSDGV